MNPELGLELPITTSYVKEKLIEMGCEVEEIPYGGLVALIGNKTGNTILLRADMDALPLQEQSGLSFASNFSGISHSCGHDLHTTFLLGAAKMLKEKEHELVGTVKLMFQSGEETLEGAKRMLDSGVLENPKVNSAIGIHVQPLLPLKALNYSKGAILASSDTFEITVYGKSCHGAQPHLGVDPINIAATIIHLLQAFQVKEVPSDATVVLNICEIKSGHASNIVPDTALLTGTLRTYDNVLREMIKVRICEIVEGTANIFGATSKLRFLDSCPCTENDPTFTESLEKYIHDVGIDFNTEPNYRLMVSDDFGLIAREVPSTMFIIGCKPEVEETSHNHNSKVIYNENVLVQGAALLAHCAFNWVNNE